MGTASWYGRSFQGKPTASGQPFDMRALTAAHRTLPLGSRIRVTNLRNHRSAILRVNDRGPWTKGRMLDLSYGAAQALGMVRDGVAPVCMEVVH